MKRVWIVLVAFIFTRNLISQDLPPGVLLFSRVRTHMDEELHRQTTISCLETIQREHLEPKGKMRPLDTVRLEVITNGEKELYSSPGDRRFSESHPMEYAGSGAMGTGLFGPYLRDILLSGSVASQYQGEEEVGGRRTARYDYRIPLFISGQTIQTAEGSGKVGLHGSFWADTQTYDVTRLEMAADEIPPNLPVSEMTTTITYARTNVSKDLIVLIPDAAEVRLVMSSGETNQNRIGFTHCRVFGAESRIDFDSNNADEQPARFGIASVDDTLRPLPAGLQVAIKLRSAISADTVVGTLIEGMVSSDVTAKHAVVIPAGSPVLGRVRRMERFTQPFPYFIVGLEFTEVEVKGIRHLFYADLMYTDPAPGLTATLATKDTIVSANNSLLFGDTSMRETKESLSLYALPGVATFFYKGAKLELPRDFHTVWKTRALKP